MGQLNAQRVWQSTVGRKFIMGISGLLLIGYLIIHLTANLLVFLPDQGRTLNLYSHALHQLGPILTLLRIGLAATFLFHIVSGIRVALENMRARRSRYAVVKSKRGPSKMTPASRWMAITGLALLIFIPIHVKMFTLGPYYVTEIGGQAMRDIYRLVVENFSNRTTALTYSFVMFFLALHLGHGCWSALQSLGAMRPRWSPVLYSLGVVLSLLLAAGFFVLPLYVHFGISL